MKTSAIETEIGPLSEHAIIFGKGPFSDLIGTQKWA